MQVSKTNNPIAIWSLTIGKNDLSPDDIKSWCKSKCSKWVFQLERGEQTGYLHYQCTVDLKTKTRFVEVPAGWTGHACAYQTSETRNGSHFNYAMKDDTRVEGPWADNDEPDFVHADIEGTSLRPWQQRCFDQLKSQNNRNIMFIKDEQGSVGKTHFAKWCYFYKKAILVPTTCTEVQQMVGAIIAKIRDPKERRIIMIDIPRAWSTDFKKVCAFMGLVEAVKSGILCDGRNFAKEKVFNPPCVAVFYNKLPKGKNLYDFISADRIELWTDFEAQ